MTDATLQQKRLIAAVIDIAVALAIGLVMFVVALVVSLTLGLASATVASYAASGIHLLGSVAVLAYILGRDVLFEGRSFGKKTQDLKVLGPGGALVTLEESVRRNAIFAAGAALLVIWGVLQLIPCLGTAVACLLLPLLIFGLLGSFAAAILEIVWIIQDPAGIRFGDKFARTRVVRA